MNFVINNEHWLSVSPLLACLFGEEAIELLPSNTDMFDILVRIGAFESKSQARKNWNKTGKDIPHGFNSFVVGKTKKQFWVWNPIQDRC